MEKSNVIFKCNNLERIVRERINNPCRAITVDELEKVESINAFRCNIKSIEGIEFLPNLEELYLQGNKISDVSVISHLKKLKKLDLSCNNIADLRPVANLEKLSRCEFSYNPIETFFTIKENKTKVRYTEFLSELNIKNLFTPANYDYVFSFLYNPCKETAKECIKHTPVICIFIKSVLTDYEVRDCIAETISNSKVNTQYLKELQRIRIPGYDITDFIGEHGSAKAKRVMMEYALSKRN